MTQIRPVPRDDNPYPGHGISVDAHGVRHYDNLPASLLDTLQRWAERTPDAEALVELGGDRLTYRQSLGPGQPASPAGCATAAWVPATVSPCATRRASTGCWPSGAPCWRVPSRWPSTSAPPRRRSSSSWPTPARSSTWPLAPHCPTARRTKPRRPRRPPSPGCSTPRARLVAPRACPPRTRRSSPTART